MFTRGKKQSRLGWAGGCLILLGLVWSEARPQTPEQGALPNFNAGMDDLAKAINKRLNDLNRIDGDEAEKIEKEVTIGPFDGPGDVSAPRIVAMLKERLERAPMNCKVGPGAPWKVSGTFSIGERDPVSGQLPITFECKIKDRKNNPHSELIKSVFTDGTTGINALLGLSNNLPVETAKKEGAAVTLAQLGRELQLARAEAQDKSIENPKGTLVIAGNQVKAAGDSPFGMEIMLVKTTLGPNGELAPVMNNGRPVLEGPLPVRQDPNGFVFVDIPENALYAVRLINNSPADAGVALSIDGINMFEFSKNEKWKDLGKVVISKAGPDGPGKGLILGWHDDGSASMHFHVTKIGKSAAALLGRTEKVGIITATFCAAFEGEQSVPQLQRLLAGGDRGEVATGFGPLVTQQYKEERRVFGVPQATVSLRYTIPDAPPGG